MAEKNPFLGLGLQQLGNENRWIDLSPPSGEQGPTPLGVLLGGALSKIKQSLTSEEQPEVGIAPPAQQFQPATQFPELFNQQYVTPYKPGYQAPGGIAPPSSLSGFMTPGQINPQNPMAGIPPLQGFRQPTQMQQMQTNPANDVVTQVWGKPFMATGGQ